MIQPTHVGSYEVLRTLGKGGMGVVYEVRHPSKPGQRLALKLLLTDDPSPSILKRFAREAEVLAKVRHPNIVGVYDFSQDPQGNPYMVFQFVEGATLRDLCGGAPMEGRQAAKILRDLADAMSELNARQILHRDIKPENVMLTPAGRPMLLDFGLARELDAERLTVTGSILGTPSYMAPEQAEGRTKELDARTDVYGLGATLFFLLCGRAPFTGSQPMAVLKQVLLDEPSWPTEEERRVQEEQREARLLPTRSDPGPPDAGSAHGPAYWETQAEPLTPTASVAAPRSPESVDPLDFTTTGGATQAGTNDAAYFATGHGAPSSPHTLATTNLGLAGGPGFGAQQAPSAAFGSQPNPHLGARPGAFGSQPGAPGDLTFARPSAETEEATLAVDPAGAAASTVIHAAVDSRIPAALVAITRVAMAKRPEDRYDDAAALRDDLDRYLLSGDAEARSRLGAGRRRLAAVLVAGLALAGASVAATFALQRTGAAAKQASSSPGTPSPSTPDLPASPEVAKALQLLPWLVEASFLPALTKLQARFGEDAALARLAAAHADLLALRQLSGSQRTQAGEKWLAAWGSIPPGRTGPLALEIGPAHRWRHALRELRIPRRDSPPNESDEDYERFKEFYKRFAVSVAWTGPDALLCANGVRITDWDLKGERSQRSTASLVGWPNHPGKGSPLKWVITNNIVGDANRGRAFLLGTVSGVGPRGRRDRAAAAVFARGKLRDPVPIELMVENGTDELLAGAISPDGALLSAGTDRGEVLVVRAGDLDPTTLLLQDFKDSSTSDDVQALAFLEDGSLISAHGTKGKKSQLVRWIPQAELRRGDTFNIGKGAPTAMLLLDRRRALLGRRGGRVEIYQVLHSFKHLGAVENDGQRLLRRAMSSGVVVSTKTWGRLIVVGSGFEDGSRRLHFSSDRGGRIFALSSKGAITPLGGYVLSDPRDGIHSLAVSPDGRWLAAGTQLGEVLVWDLAPRGS